MGGPLRTVGQIDRGALRNSGRIRVATTATATTATTAATATAAVTIN